MINEIIYINFNKNKNFQIIYVDELHRKGNYFSNFYVVALINYIELEKISNKLNKKKN